MPCFQKCSVYSNKQVLVVSRVHTFIPLGSQLLCAREGSWGWAWPATASPGCGGPLPTTLTPLDAGPGGPSTRAGEPPAPSCRAGCCRVLSRCPGLCHRVPGRPQTPRRWAGRGPMPHDQARETPGLLGAALNCGEVWGPADQPVQRGGSASPTACPWFPGGTRVEVTGSSGAKSQLLGLKHVARSVGSNNRSREGGKNPPKTKPPSSLKAAR